MKNKDPDFDLSNIHKGVAEEILHQWTRKEPSPAVSLGAKTFAPPTTYDIVVKTISDYRNAVNRVLREMQKKTALTLTVTGVEIAVLALAVIYTNMAGILTSLGITGTTSYAQYQSWQTSAITYWSDKTKLENSVDYLKMKCDACKPNEEEKLQKVQEEVDKCFKDLTTATTTPK